VIAKQPRVIDNKAIEKIRAIGYCEYCGGRSSLQVHHIKSRGAGGGDVAENLICLCAICHGQVHSGHIERWILHEIVARRVLLGGLP